MIEVCTPQEALHFLHRIGLWPFQTCLYLVLFLGDTFRGDHMANIAHSIDKEVAFLRVAVEVILLELFQNFLDMPTCSSSDLEKIRMSSRYTIT
jgi:hypothetical protein